jgi:hypothetical protein
MIPPFSQSSEKEIIEAILGEISDTYGIKLDLTPDLRRDLDPAGGTEKGRMVLIGASHMHRAAPALRALGESVIDHSVRGWTSTPPGIKNLTEVLQSEGLRSGDCVVLDLWSNSSFVGSDECGYPVKPVRDAQDGKYHILGDLQTAPRAAIKKIWDDSEGLVAAAGAAIVILVSPFPRYLAARCCGKAEHLTNFGEKTVIEDCSKLANSIRSIVGASGGGNGSRMVLSVMEHSENTDLVDWVNHCTEADRWADPVHPHTAFYDAVAATLIATKAEVLAAAEPAGKRQRLDSVAPARTVARGRGVAVPLPAWILGRGRPGGPASRPWPPGIQAANVGGTGDYTARGRRESRGGVRGMGFRARGFRY